VYGAVAHAQGMVLAVRPDNGPCLVCLFPETAAESAAEEPLPIFPPAPVAVACLQATEAVKLLLEPAQVNPNLLVLDLWSGSCQQIPLQRNSACRCCAHRRFFYLTR
jgi:molybdopterin/thiamine biosynthesis adenylyltransferase